MQRRYFCGNRLLEFHKIWFEKVGVSRPFLMRKTRKILILSEKRSSIYYRKNYNKYIENRYLNIEK